MALLEGAEAARSFATGMSAVTNAIMSQVRAGDHIVAARALFGGCRYVVEDLMPRFGVLPGRWSTGAIRPILKRPCGRTPS